MYRYHGIAIELFAAAHRHVKVDIVASCGVQHKDEGPSAAGGISIRCLNSCWRNRKVLYGRNREGNVKLVSLPTLQATHETPSAPHRSSQVNLWGAAMNKPDSDDVLRMTVGFVRGRIQSLTLRLVDRDLIVDCKGFWERNQC